MSEIIGAALVSFVVSIAIWAPFLIWQRIQLRQQRRRHSEILAAWDRERDKP